MMFGCAKNLNESKKKWLFGGDLYQYQIESFSGDRKKLDPKIISKLKLLSIT